MKKIIILFSFLFFIQLNFANANNNIKENKVKEREKIYNNLKLKKLFNNSFLNNEEYINEKISLYNDFANLKLKKSNIKEIKKWYVECINFSKRNYYDYLSKKVCKLQILEGIELKKVLKRKKNSKLNSYLEKEKRLYLNFYKKNKYQSILFKPLGQKKKEEKIDKDIDGTFLVFIPIENDAFLNVKPIRINNIIKEDLFELGKSFIKENPKKILSINQGYRTIEEQKEIYNSFGGKKQSIATIPGTSEHHLGTAIDFKRNKTFLYKDYGWLIKNSYKFGFVQSYNQYSYPYTLIKEERWHFRWIGKKLSSKYKKYLEENKKGTFILFLREIQSTK